MKDAAKYLEEHEWSMGHGQCPECCGVHPGWHGHLLHMTPDTIGHKAECSLAKALKDAGGTPVMIGEYKSDVEFEHFFSKSGVLGVRRKTKNGCPRYRKFAKESAKRFAELLLIGIASQKTRDG